MRRTAGDARGSEPAALQRSRSPSLACLALQRFTRYTLDQILDDAIAQFDG
jgi:hypothetical protein